MPVPTMTDTSWATDIGRRPDLEAVDVNPPIGFVGERIYPRTNQRLIAGTITALALPGYTAAQTNRTDGEAPTAAKIGNVTATFSCTETAARVYKTAKDVQAAGGVFASDMQGAIGSIFNFNVTLEQKRLTKLITPVYGNYNLITPDAGTPIRRVLFNAFKELRRYRGRRVLIIGASLLDVFGDSFAVRSFYQGMPLERKESYIDRTEQIVSSMQTVFHLDEVLVADDTILNDAGNAPVMGDNVLVCAVLPHENEVTEDSFQTTNIELGRTITYQPAEGMKPFQIESFPDFDNMVNKYTAIGLNDIQEFNPMAKRIINLENVDFNGGAPVSVTGGTIVTIDGGTVSA